MSDKKPYKASLDDLKKQIHQEDTLRYVHVDYAGFKDRLEKNRGASARQLSFLFTHPLVYSMVILAVAAYVFLPNYFTHEVDSTELRAGFFPLGKVNTRRDYMFHQDTEIQVSKGNRLSLTKDTMLEFENKTREAVAVKLKKGILGIDNKAGAEAKNIIYVEGIEFHEIGTAYTLIYTNNMAELKVTEGQVLVVSPTSNLNQLVEAGDIYLIDPQTHEILKKVEEQKYSPSQPGTGEEERIDTNPLDLDENELKRLRSMDQVMKSAQDIHGNEEYLFALDKRYLTVYDKKNFAPVKSVSISFQEKPIFVFGDEKFILVTTDKIRHYIYSQQGKYWRSVMSGLINVKNIYQYGDQYFIVNKNGNLFTYDSNFRITKVENILAASIYAGVMSEDGQLFLPDFPNRLVIYSAESGAVVRRVNLPGIITSKLTLKDKWVKVKLNQKEFALDNETFDLKLLP